MRRLLNGHPRIFCPPEIKFHKDLLCQFPGDLLAHGRLGSSIKALQLPVEVYLDEFGRALCRCYELAARNAGKSRWADKNPENAINAMHWDRLLQGEMMFVLVVRHPFDIVASMQEAKMDKVIAPYAQGRAQHVANYITSGLAFVGQHPDRSVMLRYEELVAQPQKQLHLLMERLGECYDDRMLIGLGSKNHGKGLEDPKARLHSDISTVTVGRWRKDICGNELKIMRPILAPIAAELGYDLD